jgi:hypothetical protein
VSMSGQIIRAWHFNERVPRGVGRKRARSYLSRLSLSGEGDFGGEPT